MKRKIIKIDEEKCDGCGLCIPECHEVALQMIDGKARLISDLFCDGLGACLGHCPQGAIEVIEREAEPYSERKVILELLEKPRSVLKAHLEHLLDHKAIDLYEEGVAVLNEHGVANPVFKSDTVAPAAACGCPGSQMKTLKKPHAEVTEQKGNGTAAAVKDLPSQLGQWPVQLHLVNPMAPYFKNSELVVMSTCGPLASANVHEDYLKGRSVVVACPKLDYTDPYTDKLTEIFSMNNTPKVIVVIMEVPCCKGLSQFVFNAAAASTNKNLAIEIHTMSIDGTIKSINFVNAKKLKENVNVL